MNIGTFGRVAGCGAAGLALGLAIVAPATAGVGDLDSQFGQGGQIQVAGNVGPNALELSDGRILVVGRRPPLLSSGTVQSRCGRLTPSGRPI